MGDLTGQVAVITGASQGIGWAIAETLASQGVHVVLNARGRERLEQRVAELKSKGYSVMGYVADVSRPSDMQDLAEQAVQQWGALNIWVNNAGDTVVNDSIDLDPEEFSRIIAVNLNGAFYGSQAAARYMTSGGGGVIIQMGSIFGEVGAPRRVAYVASKHALLGLTKVLADEWAEFGIRVLCVEPGYIRTGLALPNASTGDDYCIEDIAMRTPMGRYGTPLEVARVIAFLVSDSASYMTGSAVRIDGGWVAHGGWRGRRREG